MGDLIIMKRSQDIARVAIASGESAEILFFTGVRYYRMAEDETPASLVRRRSEKAKKASQARRHKARAASGLSA